MEKYPRILSAFRLERVLPNLDLRFPVAGGQQIRTGSRQREPGRSHSRFKFTRQVQELSGGMGVLQTFQTRVFGAIRQGLTGEFRQGLGRLLVKVINKVVAQVGQGVN